MSFVKKAVKKVFNFHKKLFKKSLSFTKRLLKNRYFQIALVIAASVFTAGVAAGGFAAFSGVSSVGSFFSAVGTTISTGFSSITAFATGAQSFAQAFPVAANALGMTAAPVAATTANTTGVLAAGMGAPATTAAAAGGTAAANAAAATAGYGAGITNSALAAAGQGTAAVSGITAASSAGMATLPTTTGWNVINAGTGVGAQPAATGYLSKIGSLLMDKGVGGTMMRGGIMAGIQGYYKQKELDKQEYYYRNRTVYGKAAFGSGNSDGIPMLRPSWSNQFTGGSGLLNAPQPKTPSPYDQAPSGGDMFQQEGMFTQNNQQAAPGVPGQQTQAPPATQPNGGIPTPGSQLENLGVG
jgi:hypothetical protein